MEGIGRICAHAALDTEPHLVAEKPGHILLFMQVPGVLMDMVEAVDRLPRKMRDGGTEIPAFGIPGSVESNPHDIDRAFLPLIKAVHLFTAGIKVAVHLTQSFDILFPGSHISGLPPDLIYLPAGNRFSSMMPQRS